jgi:hypothetical protein
VKIAVARVALHVRSLGCGDVKIAVARVALHVRSLGCGDVKIAVARVALHVRSLGCGDVKIIMIIISKPSPHQLPGTDAFRSRNHKPSQSGGADSHCFAGQDIVPTVSEFTKLGAQSRSSQCTSCP